MPGLMESYAAGAEAITRADVAITDRQRSELQRMYMPEKFQQEAIQQKQATEIQALNLQKLQETVAGEAALRPLMQQYYSNPKNQQKPLSEQDRDLSIIATNAGKFDIATKLREDAVKAAKEESDAVTSRLKTQDALLEHGQQVLNNINPTDDESWNKGLLNLDASGGNSNRIKADAAQFGREKAIEMAIERAKTFRQRQEERRAEEAKVKADQGEKRIEQGWSRIEAILAKTAASTRDKEISADAKERKQAIALTSNMNREATRLHDKYIKDRAIMTDPDKQIAADETYQEDLVQLNQRYEGLFATASLPFTPLVSERVSAAKPITKTSTKPIETKPTTEVPAYGAWMGQARAANPDATTEELKAYYDKKYGKK